MKARSFLAGTIFGVLLGGVGAFGLRQALRSGQPQPKAEPALTVNDEQISMETLKSQALLVNSNQILANLVEQKVISQEAARQQIKLTPEDQQQVKKIKDGPNAQAAREQLETALLVRHLLLSGVKEEQIRQTYDLFKDELTQYELFVIVLTTRKSGQELQKSLEEGSSFDTLVTNFSIDPSRERGGRVGFLTMPQIRRALGQEAADEVARLKPNQVGKVIYTPFGLTVLKLGEVKSEYKDLKPLAEGLIAESHRVDLMYRLYSKAKINSPFMQEAPNPVPEDRSGIKPGNSGLPAPENSGPGAQSLPAPEQTP